MPIRRKENLILQGKRYFLQFMQAIKDNFTGGMTIRHTSVAQWNAYLYYQNKNSVSSKNKSKIGSI